MSLDCHMHCHFIQLIIFYSSFFQFVKMVFVISHLATEITVYLRNWCGLLRIWILLSFDGPE